MVLVSLESNDKSKIMIGWFIILTVSIFIRTYNLQHTNFFNLSDKESVTVNVLSLSVLQGITKKLN